MSSPAAHAEELDGAGMGIGEVVQQSGHEGGEAGHGGARVSAAAAAEGGDVGGRPTCCVCMEPWTDSGAHRSLRSALSALDSSSQQDKKGLCSSQASVSSGPSGYETDLLKQVLDILHEPANIEKEHGVHVDEIVKRFRLPEGNIRDAIMQHMDIGNIYSTIDDFHFMSACIPNLYPSIQQGVLTFQVPQTGGPSVSESDLCNQVLDILREPTDIEKEHGLHFDEIVKRFKLPERKIMDAILYHLDVGHIYRTIDDYHFIAP